jgi:hypothetical protein
LPAAYAYRVYVVNGGLLTYSTDISSQYRRAANYVDRILKGEKPVDPAGANANQVCRSFVGRPAARAHCAPGDDACRCLVERRHLGLRLVAIYSTSWTEK